MCRRVGGAADTTVEAARDSSATLDAGTNSGRIHNTLRNTDGAATRLKIHATTGREWVDTRLTTYQPRELVRLVP